MKIFLIGIKGNGMSALANILSDQGHEILGSDIDKYFSTEEELLKRKIKIFPFKNTNITQDIDLIIQGNAFDDNHEEVIEAKKLDLNISKYYQVLNNLQKEFISTAISGTHGKTSTTGLLKSILSEKFKTSHLIGDGDGEYIKDSTHFVFEACEYKERFLNYYPKYLLINNIEFDHPDYFKDITDVKSTFEKFINQSDNIIYNGDDENILDININKNKLSFGLKENNNIRAININYGEKGIDFDLIYNEKKLGKIKTNFYGKYMIYNTLACITIAVEMKLNIEEIQKGIYNYKFAKRRFQIEEINNIALVNDYAHHPTEITMLVEAIRQKYPKRKLKLVFQPHTFTRTIELFDEFIKALNLADEIYLKDIFASARETKGNITIENLIENIDNSQKLNKLQPETNDVIAFVGAGDIDEDYIKLIEKLKK